jgi:hypothetical protein
MPVWHVRLKPSASGVNRIAYRGVPAGYEEIDPTSPASYARYQFALTTTSKYRSGQAFAPQDIRVGYVIWGEGTRHSIDLADVPSTEFGC